MKNVQFPSKNVHVGQNYVFFSSLLKDDPTLASKAQDVLSSQIGELSFSESSQNKMSAMVHFFDAVIKREQNNEKLFLQRQREKFRDMPNFQSIFKYLDTNSFNYIDFIKMLNIAIKGAEQCKATLANELIRVQQLQAKVNQHTAGKSNAQKRRFSESTIRISTLATTGILDKKTMDQINKTAVGISGEKIEQAMAEIIKDPNLLIQIKNFIEQNYPLDLEGKKIKVTNSIIVKYLVQALYKKLDITQVQKNITQIFDTSLDSAFSVMPIVQRNSRIKMNNERQFYVESHGLADEYLKKINKRKKKNPRTVLDFAIMKKDQKEIQNQEIDDIANFIAKIKDNKIKDGEYITIGKTTYLYENGTYIRKGSKKKDQTISKKQMISNLKMRFSVILRDFIQDALAQDELMNIINSDFYINTPKLSEALAGIQASLIQGIQGNAHISGYLNLKNDVEFFISYNPTAFIKRFQTKKNELLNKFSDIVAEQQKKLRDEKQKTKGDAFATTDPVLSTKAFYKAISEALKEAHTYLKDLNYNNDMIREEFKFLFNGFYVQESVKDIQFLNPEVGFKGGTLGGDWETALQNLLKMYRLGGLSTINYKWLHFAIMNSSSASLGGFLKNPIQKYLSFAAAMMMFNYGGAELVRVANELKNDFSTSSGPEFLNLYVLDGIYVPSSYILTLIRNGLSECEAYLMTEVKPSSTNLSETGVKIINKSSPAWIDPNADPYDAEWGNIGAQTRGQIEIIFTFLGGFLDIIDELNSRMAI